MSTIPNPAAGTKTELGTKTVANSVHGKKGKTMKKHAPGRTVASSHVQGPVGPSKLRPGKRSSEGEIQRSARGGHSIASNGGGGVNRNLRGNTVGGTKSKNRTRAPRY